MTRGRRRAGTFHPGGDVPDLNPSIAVLPPPVPPSTVPVASGIDPAARKAHLVSLGLPVDPKIQAAIDAGIDLNNEDVAPAPKFPVASYAYHRANGERVWVCGHVFLCTNPAHAEVHRRGIVSLPDCVQTWTGEYVVSAGPGGHVVALESELVEVAGG